MFIRRVVTPCFHLPAPRLATAAEPSKRVKRMMQLNRQAGMTEDDISKVCSVRYYRALGVHLFRLLYGIAQRLKNTLQLDR